VEVLDPKIVHNISFIPYIPLTTISEGDDACAFAVRCPVRREFFRACII
jgi:hypothetical protein